MALDDAPLSVQTLEPVPFQEAIEWHHLQAPWISGSSWEEMTRLAAEKGHQVSRTTLLGMLDHVWRLMDRAVTDGLPFSDFSRDLGETLGRAWGGPESPRLRLIFHNNVGGALMAGRFAQLSDPVVLADRPYWLYDAIEDFRTSRICEERDGVKLPATDPWWERNRPLLHHGCRSSVISLDADDLAEEGGLTTQKQLADLPAAQDGWGAPASWQAWQPAADQYHAALWAEYERWRDGEVYQTDRTAWVASMQALVGDALAEAG